MKKTTVISGLFLFVFGLTMGISIAFTQDAEAKMICTDECVYRFECRTDFPWLCAPLGELWARAMCVGGPLMCRGNDYWTGECCEAP